MTNLNDVKEQVKDRADLATYVQHKAFKKRSRLSGMLPIART
jgi:hypothetical protein